MSPAAALGAANGTGRPLKGKSTGTTTVSLVTGVGTNLSSGHLSHLGAFTGRSDLLFTRTSPTTFSFTGTETDLAADGDKLFSTITGSGTFASTTTAEATDFNTITGGTGRFADASGMFTKTSSIVVVSITATSETAHPTSTINGQIRFSRPLEGRSTGTAIVNTATGTGTVDGAFVFTHLGKGASHTDLTGFTTAGNALAFTGTATFVAAKGDKVFTTIAGTGMVTSTGSVVTTVDTITGGTGRFADASGTFTITTVGVTVSTIGSISTETVSGTVQGRISYKARSAWKGLLP